MSEGPVTDVAPHERVLHIRILKRAMDDTCAETVLTDVEAAAEATPDKPIILDMTQVTFAPSVALGVLIKLNREFKLQGRRFALVGVQRRVYEALQVTQMHKVIPLFDNLQAALTALTAAK